MLLTSHYSTVAINITTAIKVADKPTKLTILQQNSIDFRAKRGPFQSKSAPYIQHPIPLNHQTNRAFFQTVS